MSISSIGNTNTYRTYQQLASGNKINSAADDAAGLAIAEKLETQKNSYDVGKDNAATSQDMLNVAEGGLSSITDYLQRIRELSVQAMNTAIYGDSELSAIQKEIDQLKQGITDVADGTTFNTMKLLDGSMTSSHVASNPDGSGLDISIPNATLAALGIADYDVTKSFDISDIDKALETVTSARSSIGATSNRLDHVMNYNSYASYNMTASRSRIADTDYAKTISEQKKEAQLQLYRNLMLKKQMESEAGVVRLIK